jgi:hypothetical protein
MSRIRTAPDVLNPNGPVVSSSCRSSLRMPSARLRPCRCRTSDTAAWPSHARRWVRPARRSRRIARSDTHTSASPSSRLSDAYPEIWRAQDARSRRAHMAGDRGQSSLCGRPTRGSVLHRTADALPKRADSAPVQSILKWGGRNPHLLLENSDPISRERVKAGHRRSSRPPLPESSDVLRGCLGRARDGLNRPAPLPAPAIQKATVT